MDECKICFTLSSNFFNLVCCRNRLCRNCLDYLSIPMCPFCRAIINEIKDDPKYRLCRSLETDYLSQQMINRLVNEQTIMEPSRIQRRQQRRERRLVERDEDVQRNKHLSRAQKKKETNKEIEECIFALDDLEI